VVNAVLKAKDHPKRNREFRVNTALRTRKPKTYSGGYRRVTTAVHKVEGDNITFVSGCLTEEGTPGWMQVDPGSDIACVLAEYVASLGMQHQMVKQHQYVVNAVLKAKDHPKRNREFRVHTALRTR
jgi:hypothetical protein